MPAVLEFENMCDPLICKRDYLQDSKFSYWLKAKKLTYKMNKI